MEYKLGAIKNTKDLRDIKLAQIQEPVEVPFEYYTDISYIPVLNQRNLGACVGHAHAVVHIYNEYKENKNIKALSPRYIYALSKKIDGYLGEGTYPRVSAKIETDNGCATENTVPNDTTLSHTAYTTLEITQAITKDASPFKIKGYAFVNNDAESIKQAIYKNGLIVVSISVGNYTSPIKKGSIGLHRVVLYGWKGDTFYFRNSWGNGWGDNGNGYFDFKDQALEDLMSFVDMPNEILMEAKKKYKYFSDKEIVGLKPELVSKLDTMRGECGFPFIINSGFRTVEENAKLKDAVIDSAHTLGLAVDLKCLTSDNRFKIIQSALKNGITRIGVGSNFIHLDIDINKPSGVIWTY